MGSALLNTETVDSTSSPPADPSAIEPTPSRAATLRRQAAERIAAHRSRHSQAQPRTTPEPARPATGRSARIAAAVAERYARTQSYRAFLAAEAERAVQQARAAAEIAALNARAVAAAQQSLLDTFDQAPVAAGSEDAALSETLSETLELSVIPTGDSYLFPDLPLPRSKAEPKHRAVHSNREAPTSPAPASNLEPCGLNRASFTVRLYEDDSSAAHVDLDAARRAGALAHANRAAGPARNDAEALALDEEIAFRQAPVFEEPAGPPTALPANLIEFPRQLIAPRKARPRLAEGPLRDEIDTTPGDSQLRIFEVDPAQISTTPAAEPESDTTETVAPQWTSIWLDSPATSSAAIQGPASSDVQAATDAVPRATSLPGVASIGRRTLAAAINSAIVFTAVLAFAAVFVAVTTQILPWQPGSLHTLSSRLTAGTGIQLIQLPAALATTTGFLLLLYQALFFWFSTATPGMRCARIALCTFDDENPTRRALRRRIFAVLLSACPLGLGFLWATLDEDRLAWHDRISRTYQRSY